MPPQLTWPEIALRLFCAVVAGTLIGINRGEHGRPVGLRTTLLVCLAACLSMIQVNLLLTLRGKAPDSYIVMDLMRLPLGVLSGMGFIGAGAILRKDDLILGVTTAATLWFVTILGLCFGGGQISLGWTGLALGIVVLWLLKPVEKNLKHDRQARLDITIGIPGPNEEELAAAVLAAGYEIASFSVVYDISEARGEVRYLLKWRSRGGETTSPALVIELARRPNIIKVSWQP